MVTVMEVRKLAERLAKAEALEEAGAVFPVRGLADYAVVRNGDGTQMYLVRFEAGREHCTCPDFEHRQGTAGQPCKHIMAAQLAAEATPKAAASRLAGSQSCSNGRRKMRQRHMRHGMAPPSRMKAGR